MTTVMGIRVSEELKRELENYGYDSEAIRMLLEEDLKKKRMKKAMEKLAESRAKIGKKKGDLSTQIIREMRDSG